MTYVLGLSFAALVSGEMCGRILWMMASCCCCEKENGSLRY